MPISIKIKSIINTFEEKALVSNDFTGESSRIFKGESLWILHNFFQKVRGEMLVTSLCKASVVLTPAQDKEPLDQWQDPSAAPFAFDLIFLCPFFSLHTQKTRLSACPPDAMFVTDWHCVVCDSRTVSDTTGSAHKERLLIEWEHRPRSHHLLSKSSQELKSWPALPGPLGSSNHTTLKTLTKNTAEVSCNH